MKKYVLVIILLLCTVMLNGCNYFGPGMADYAYVLSGNYELFHAGPTRIWSDKGAGKEVIAPEVTGIAWNDDFILAEQKVNTKSNYWIIDSKNKKIFGPLDNKEFDAKKSELKIDANLKLENPEKYQYLEGKK